MKIGILGGGQLAQMLAQAGAPLGMEFMFLCPSEEACAAPLGQHLCNDFDDATALDRLRRWADVATFEFENVPASVIEILAAHTRVYPPARALAVAQDRLREKQTFDSLEIPTPAYTAVDSQEQLSQAVGRLGLPAVLKTRTQGYDGKGQTVLKQQADLLSAWERLGGVPLILEAFVPFERELSIIAVRSAKGETRCYCLSENHHRDGILRLALSRCGDPLQDMAERYVQRLLQNLDYVGTLALELFQTEHGLLANEIAPRVHNSGHWSIEGAACSQFENHLRAVSGLPLGDTSLVQPAAMVNLIGRLPDLGALTAVPGAFPHIYGKSERAGRKLGHVTLTADGPAIDAEFQKRLASLLRLTGEMQLATTMERLSAA
ncbi:MAG: 5-(carboxyamino)imidazole ribonucleotide synthase [Gammaproteobacteria bacterium]|nr:5-(carboxyamino)imidazole ribonucleotide synthase [Gammaproteobacteria bacterium]